MNGLQEYWSSVSDAVFVGDVNFCWGCKYFVKLLGLALFYRQCAIFYMYFFFGLTPLHTHTQNYLQIWILCQNSVKF